MKKAHFLNLLLNTFAICLLVVVAVYGDSERTLIQSDGSVLRESLHVNKLLILPIIMLLYNSFYIIKRTLESEE